MQRFYNVCTRCYMADHSQEKCPQLQFWDEVWDEELFNNKESDIELNENEFQAPEAILIPYADKPCYEEAMRDFFNEDSIIIPIVEPFSTTHERPPDVSLPISSSTHVPSIKKSTAYYPPSRKA